MKESRDRSATIAEAARDVILVSIVRGQAFPVMLCVALIVVVLRLEPSALGSFVDQVIKGLESASLMGWALVVATIYCWRLHVRIVRRLMRAEIDRVASERTALQAKLMGRPTESSTK